MNADLPDVLREMSAELARMADRVEGYRAQLAKLSKPEVDRVVQCVCKTWNVSEVRLRSESHCKDVAEARFACYALLREAHNPLSLVEIGKAFARHYTAVAHGLYRARDLRATDQTYAGMIVAAKQLYEQSNATQPNTPS